MRRAAVVVTMVLLLVVSSTPVSSFLEGTTGEPDYTAKAEDDLSSIKARILILEQTGFSGSLDEVINNILARERFVFLFFYADWCHFCSVEKPIIDELEPSYSDKVLFIRLNQARNPEALKEFNVKGYPTMFLVYGKTGDAYTYVTLSGFKQKAFLENLIRNAVNYQFGYSPTVGGFFDHQSCSFSDCVDACTDDKEIDWQEIADEAVDTVLGCVTPLPVSCINMVALPGEDPGDMMGCLFDALAKTFEEKVDCAYSIGHLIANILGGQQLGECLGECAADPGSYGQLCNPGEQRSKCTSVRGFISMSECNDECNWAHVPGSVTDCGFGSECVEGAGGASCKDPDDPNPDPNDPPQEPPTIPGNDKPDDNFDVSTLWQNWDTSVPNENATVSRIAVLNRGYPLAERGLVSFLRNNLDESPAVVDLRYLEYLKPSEYPVLIIPSGGLFGLPSSSYVRASLEGYVAKGGTLIAFSQQMGTDYSILPGGEVGGFGWIEDQSCHSNSAGMSTYHPILSGQKPSDEPLDLNVDGFFTKWPENATILLTRVRNGMPAMFLYEYGRGRVVASNLYGDLSPAFTGIAAEASWSTSAERVLLRDLFTWAQSNDPVSTIVPNEEATIGIDFTNSIAYSPSWPRFNQGDIVSIPVNVMNRGDATATKVVFTLIDPAYHYEFVEVPTSLAPGASGVLTLNYQTNSSSRNGVWMILYSLYTATGKIGSYYQGCYLLGISLGELSTFKANLVLQSPIHQAYHNKEVVRNVTFTFSASPSETKSLNLTFTPDVEVYIDGGYGPELGVWTLDYIITTLSNTTVHRGTQNLAVSPFAENPNGWSYQSENLTFSITSESETYIDGESATFTIHAWNRGEANRTIIVQLSGAQTIPANQQIFLMDTPAHGEAVHTVTIAVNQHISRWVAATFLDHSTNSYLGLSVRAFFTTYPYLRVLIETDGAKYIPGEKISLLLDVTNPLRENWNTNLYIRILDPNNEEVLTENFNVLIPSSYHSENTISLTLPSDLKPEVYIIDTRIFHSGRIIGSGTAAFEVPTLYLKADFDKASYRARETVGLDVVVNNYYPFQQNQTLSVAIPSISFSTSAFVQVESGETKTVHFEVTLPSIIEAGTHRLITTLLPENVIRESGFTVPNSNLQVELNKLDLQRLEDLIINIENSGGVDTTYDYGVVLKDKYFSILLEEKRTGTLMAGNSLIVSYTIPEGATDGTYMLYIQVSDLRKGVTQNKFYAVTIDGLSARLAAVADKEAYSTTENVTILSNIENLKATITNAVLKLQISSSQPAPPKECVVPHDDLYITEDTVFCPGNYSISDAGAAGVIIVQADNIVLDFNGVHLNGTLNTGYGIYNSWYNNVTVKNTKITNYQHGIYMLSSRNTVVNNELTATAHYGYGIDLRGQANLVLNNTVTGYYYGIYAVSLGNMILSNNVADNTRGIQAAGNSIVVKNSATINSYGVYLASAFNITVMENHVVGTGTSGGTGIFADVVRNSLIFNNTVESNNYGIFPRKSDNNTIVYNIVKFNTRGIHVEDSTNIVVAYNTAEYNNNGIVLYRWVQFPPAPLVFNNTVSANTVRFNTQGIYIYVHEGHDNNVFANTITDNTQHGIRAENLDNSTIASNIIANNAQNGITLSSSALHNLIVNNTITGNPQYGLSTSTSDYFNLIVNNTFAYNGYGIYLQGSNTTIVYHNNFVNNTLYHAYSNSYYNVWDNGYPSGGNYWTGYAALDEYSGPYQNITGSDGIGDSIYISGTVNDTYPFINPNAWTPYNFTVRSVSFTPPTYTFPRVNGLQVAAAQLENEASYILWTTSIPVDVGDSLDLSTPAGSMGVTGKLYVVATLYSSSGQIIAWSISSFYVKDTEVYLTLETDKQVYRPNEDIQVHGVARNTGTSPKSVTLTITNNETTLYSESFTLDPGADRSYQFITTSDVSFTLEGSVDGFTATEPITIAAPQVSAAVNVPYVVGRSPFETVLELLNEGLVPASLNITIGDSEYLVTVPANQTTLIKKIMIVNQNTTLTITITGDYAATITEQITFGEAAAITVETQALYVEGTVTIPFEIVNLGILETEFNITFTLNNKTIIKPVYLPVNGSLTDSISLNLTRGIYTLSYSTPFQQGTVTVNVEAPAEIVVVSLPENETFELGEQANMTVTLKNVGGLEGDAHVKLTVPGIDEQFSVVWIAPGEETNVTLSFEVPDDLKEKYYKAIFEINNEKYQLDFFVKGAEISVQAALDEALYQQGENATLMLIIQNLRDMNLTLFTRVKFGDYDTMTYFNLSNLETRTLSFTMPALFNAGKLNYMVYMASGRALYINALYIYQKPLETAGIILYTDKQVYEMEETVTVYVNVTKSGTLAMTAPNFNSITALLAGAHVFTFQLPKLRTGTHMIQYTFEGYSSECPIDVIGYSARIIDAKVDKATYKQGDLLNLMLTVETGREFNGFVKAWIFDPQDRIIQQSMINVTFAAGENEVRISIPSNISISGIHAVAFRVYAYGSFIFLSSGAAFFDSSAPDLSPPDVTHIPVTTGVENQPIGTYAIVTDDVNVAEVALYYRRLGEQDYTRILMLPCQGCIDSYNATIPASAVMTATIEYYINATDGTNYTTHPITDPTANPHVISINLYPTPVVLSQPGSITENSLRLSWTENTAADFKNYTIYQSDLQGSLGSPIHTITTRSSTFYDVTGLASNTTYHFVIRVYDTGGLYADSNQVAATTLTAIEGAGFPWIPAAVGLPVVAVAIIAVIAFFAKKRRKREVSQTANKT